MLLSHKGQRKATHDVQQKSVAEHSAVTARGTFTVLRYDMYPTFVNDVYCRPKERLNIGPVLVGTNLLILKQCTGTVGYICFLLPFKLACLDRHVADVLSVLECVKCA